MIDEKIRVDIIVYEKKGIASKKHSTRPWIVYPYMPEIHTPKLVTKKKIKAPDNAPKIRRLKLALNRFEIRPISKTLPQVKKVPKW